MPVSGGEETGVKPAIPWHSSDYPGGIPIKKRRYPMIRPPSPPPEEPSSSPVDSNSLQKDQSSPSQGSTISCSSAAASSSCLPDALKSSEPEERRGGSNIADDHALKGNDKFAKVKVEEPSLLVQPASLDSLKNLVAARNPASRVVSGKSELILAPAKSLASDVVNMHTGPSAEVKVEAKTALQEKTEPLLSLKEHFRPVLSSLSNDRSDLNLETSEPISLKLSLSKESISINRCKSGVVDELDGGSSHLCADRANWDLNTPMEKWVGPLSDLAASQTLLGGIDATEDVKPTIGVSVTSEKRSNIERENLPNLSILSNLSSQQYKSGDSLDIRVSPRLQTNGKEWSSPTLKLNSDKVIPSAGLPRVIGPSSSFNKVNVGTVKSEPVDESLKLETRGAEPSNVASLDSATLKGESFDRGSLEALKSSPSCTQKLVDPRPIKPEPALETNKSTINAKEGKSFQSNEKVVQDPDKHSSAAAVCKTLQTAGSAGKNSLSAECKNSPATVMLKTAEISSPVASSSFSTDDKHSSAAAACKTTEVVCPIVSSSLSTESARSRDLSSHSGQLSFTNGSSLEVHHEACESSRLVAPDLGAMLTSVDSLPSVDGKVERANTGDSNVDNHELCKSELINDLPVNSRGNGVGAASEEEKVNVSVDIEVSYGTDYESDCNHAVDMSIDMEIDSEDDYEDGEVRESLEHIAVKEPGYEKGHLERNHSSDLNEGNANALGVINDDNPSSANIEVQVVKTDIAETEKDAEEALNAAHNVKCEKGSGKAPLLQDSTIENPLGGALLKETSEAVFRSPLVQSGLRGAQEYQEIDCGQVSNGGVEPLRTIFQGSGLCFNEDDLEPKHDMALNKSSTNVDNAVKDIDNGSNRSRIINLPRSSESSSPGNTRTFSGRFLPVRAERDRLSDLALEGDNIHSRGREDIYVDGIKKFSRERHHDQTPRNSRLNFMQGRATINRLDNLCGDRESNREFASEFYDGPAGFRVPRHKFASVSDADLEYNGYNVAQDVPFVGSGRGGRKPLNDGGAFVRRVPSRRRSPGAARGMHMVRRISRNISPNRSVTDNGSELVRPRRNVRGFRDDGIDPMFSHPQPSYETVDGHFSQGNRNFPSVQRRVMHRIRSKSPLGPRTRSPGAWSSPRRRSPDGFSGHPDLTRQRSPPFYRIERMRSPDRRCFPGEVMVRRQDLRDMDSGRDHGHPGSGMPNNRSPSSRIVIRERRFGGLDPQERREGDEFYGGPMHSGRLHELGGEANGEERRFGDRRGPLRPYRTSFNGADGESFHLNSEDGSRPMRFCSDDNPDSQDRGNLVERDFNRRIKSRPVNAPRRMRNIDDQEGNYRHGSQVWHNNSFDEMSRAKRKRY